jgi:hypothetical protein
MNKPKPIMVKAPVFIFLGLLFFWSLSLFRFGCLAFSHRSQKPMMGRGNAKAAATKSHGGSKPPSFFFAKQNTPIANEVNEQT